MKKITISIPDEIADKAARAVESGNASSVSAWFADLARREPDWAAASEILAELAAEAGVTGADREWAAGVFDEIDAERTDALGGAA
ncbi:hypothetical protein IU459_26915 [Nocardia amamiensis]|uniref:Uncharacterized protein n=1 Tax=Nocardia amamiensis TaxID=404578 RepID=A0ABS0CX34_9NOCA|nr:hypothetical protein [Nocardia amamiensis]MBF6301147.1 hypothetical protein [Nocardia amamiensis]